MPAATSVPPRAGAGGWWFAGALALLAVVIVAVAVRGLRQADAGASAAPHRAAAAATALEPVDAPPELSDDFAVVTTEEAVPDAMLRKLDPAAVRDLQVLKLRGIPSDADLEAAERVLARHAAGIAELPSRVANLYIRAARADHDAHRANRAAARLQRAAALLPGRGEPWLALSAVHLDASQWAEAEAAARRAAELDPQSAQAPLHLAWALYRQDRNREAAIVLEELLSTRQDPAASALLQRIRKQGRDEAGMAEHRAAHFNLRFEGAEAAEVGHEILQALDRHRATLVTTLDHEPQAPIPVILFSSEAYYDAAGAPRWSGGVFDGIDGRIRIPIGGVDRSLTPEMDETLVHEMTHAFVADLSKNVCPRDVHEGFAQYMEGKRSEQTLGDEGLTMLAAGRIRGVYGFYAGALSFVEHLVAERGLGGMRELLLAMGETRSEEAAFERVFGRGAGAMRRSWVERLRQRYPS